VVDYAETCPRLNRLLADLAGEEGVGVPVLLLARAAGDWWDQLGVTDPVVFDLVQAALIAIWSCLPLWLGSVRRRGGCRGGPLVRPQAGHGRQASPLLAQEIAVRASGAMMSVSCQMNVRQGCWLLLWA
jgi:hypothetical protein